MSCCRPTCGRDLWRARFARHVVPTIPRPVFLRTKPGYRYCVIRDADYSCWKMRRMFTDIEAVCVSTQDAPTQPQASQAHDPVAPEDPIDTSWFSVVL